MKLFSKMNQIESWRTICLTNLIQYLKVKKKAWIELGIKHVTVDLFTFSCPLASKLRAASTSPRPSPSSASSPGLTTTEAGPETRDWPRNSPQPPSASPLAGHPGLWLVHTLRLRCDWSIWRQPPISRPFKQVVDLVQQICAKCKALLDPIPTQKPAERHNRTVLLFNCSQLKVQFRPLTLPWEDSTWDRGWRPIKTHDCHENLAPARPQSRLHQSQWGETRQAEWEVIFNQKCFYV